jgi:phosphate-selective porin
MGWSASATVWLTGEETLPEARPRLLGDAGGVELAVRYGRLSLRNALAAGLAAPGLDATAVESVTVGLNWWITPHVKVAVNGVRERYSLPLPFDTRQDGLLYGLLVRAAIDFCGDRGPPGGGGA